MSGWQRYTGVTCSYNKTAPL